MEQTLITQNTHWGGTRYLQPFARIHDAEAAGQLPMDEIQIITGIRRCGKSTLLKYLINCLAETNNPKSILYINFDDPNYTDACQDPASLYTIITNSEKLTGERVAFLFLDEVQQVEQWEKFVKSVYDSARFKKIVITGSNADLLNSDYASLLSGRYIDMRIYPLQFKEFLLHQKLTTLLEQTQNKPTVLSIVDNILINGCFPRIYYLNDAAQKQKLLQSYYETIILKDCIDNHRIRDTKTLKFLAYYLMSNNGTRYSYQSLSKAIGSNDNTIKQFIQIFQDAYFMEELHQFSFSLRSQAKSNKKNYCIDNGLITATNFGFIEHRASLFESLVYTELAKRYPGSVYYHNDTNECDFIVHSGSHKLAIQVCYKLTPANRGREVRGLTTAMDKFKLDNGIIITYDQQEDLVNNQAVIPFWQYFS